MDSKETTDEVEEFEFKPLTEGLGFHQKPLRMGLRDTDFVEKSTKPQFNLSPDSKPSATSHSVQTGPSSLQTKFQAPTAPNPASNPIHTKPLSTSSVGVAPKPVAPLKRTSVPAAKINPHPGAKINPPPTTKSAPKAAAEIPSSEAMLHLRPIASNWPAALVDGVLVAGLGILFLVALLIVTHVDLVGVITSSKIDRLTQLSIAAVFLAVLQLYMVISRSFFGKTLGEWAFDSQLGIPRQQRRWFFPLQVFWRTTVIVLTGVFVLPILSTIFSVDVARYISGVSLQKRSGL